MFLKKKIILQQVIVTTVLFLSGNTILFADQNHGQRLVFLAASEFDYPPFAIVRPDGTADGFSVELLKAVADAADFEINISVGPWHKIKQQLAEGSLDILPLVSYSPDRDKIFDFTVPFLQMHGTIFIRKGETFIRSENDLKDKEVLVMRDDAAHEYILSHNIPAKLFLTDTFEQAFKLLASGKHDAILCQYVMGLQLIEKLGIKNIISLSAKHEKSIKPRSRQISGFEQKFCFAVPEGRKELLALLNEGMAIVFSNGAYDRLYTKWFGPILPRPAVPIITLFKYVLFTLVPIVLFLAIFGLWYLKKEVRKKTESLQKEIQERQQAEEALKKNEEKYRELIENTEDLITHVDKEGNFTFVNHTSNKIFGVSPEECLGLPASTFIHPDDRERMNSWFAKCIRLKKSSDSIENRQISKTTGKQHTLVWASTFEFDDSGLFLGAGGIARDVTEIRTAEQNYKKLFETMLDGFALHEIICDDDGTPVDYRFLQINQAFEIQIGLKGKNLVGKTVLQVLPGTEKHWIDTYGRVALTGKPIIFENYSAELGKHFQVTAYSPDKNQFACIFQDITTRKKIEQEKKNLESQLRHAQKMEAIGTLAGGIAHDFNNILSAILGYSTLALDEIPSKSPAKYSIEQIIKAGKRASELVKHILNFSRKAEKERSPLQVDLLVKETLKLLRASIPTTITIQQDLAVNIGNILADATQIHQVVMNLCSNAAQAMDEKGGILRVELAKVDINAEDLKTEPNLKPGPYVQLTVQDTGTGINERYLDRIFDPYFTTKDVGKGSGLGLAVVIGIVKRHEGMVKVKSKLGEGTTFTVFFPIINEKVLLSTEDNSPLPIGIEKILIVDDEESIVDLTQKHAERLGYRVTTQTDSKAALELFRAQPDAFDLIITDQTMPGLTGENLANEVMKIRPDIPIIICTGYSSQMDAERASAVGFKAFIMKPVEKRELANTIRQVLDASAGK